MAIDKAVPTMGIGFLHHNMSKGTINAWRFQSLFCFGK
ncbi:hypothetical protein L910_2098 [Vibrio fluvialis PG41]|uniref:Uncharacterized protein n=1 Tax=Vibrio fluvialis PG41 TaxID=1336752 RepID=S7I9M8_VIBFL|nr:hypothetical protein L910_2098 [Vibrio fluvialis PG41]